MKRNSIQQKHHVLQQDTKRLGLHYMETLQFRALNKTLQVNALTF